MKIRLLVLAAALLALLTTMTGAALAQTPPPDERPTAKQVHAWYAGKTWLWEDGAGYFSPDRKFYAWSGSGENASIARGKWQATKQGRLCFSASWEGVTYKEYVRTCFSHRIGDDTIYQAREPDGTWYRFRHSPPRRSDEYFKLVPGDEVTATYREVRAEILAAKLRTTFFRRR
jgi:hypothetical protein